MIYLSIIHEISEAKEVFNEVFLCYTIDSIDYVVYGIYGYRMKLLQPHPF